MPTKIKSQWDCKSDLEIGDAVKFNLSKNEKATLLKLITDLKLEYKYPNKAEEEINFIRDINGLIGIYIVQTRIADSTPTKKQQEAAKNEIIYLLDKAVKHLNGGIGGLLYNLESELGTFNNKYTGNSKINDFIDTTEDFVKKLQEVEFQSNPASIRKNSKIRMALVCAMNFDMYFTKLASATCNRDLDKIGAYASLLEWCFIVADGKAPNSLCSLVKTAIERIRIDM